MTELPDSTAPVPTTGRPLWRVTLVPSARSKACGRGSSRGAISDKYGLPS